MVISLGYACSWAAQNYDSLAYAYVSKYKDVAIEEMERVNIPASITLAQGILETGFGTSVLMLNTNNHFGIKCHETWTGKTYSYTDDAPDECFRVYDSPEQSFRDHSDFLRGRPRYAKLFALDPKDYKAWAYGLKEAGYATNPKYPELLIKYIETYQLYKYDTPDYIEEDWMLDDRPVTVVEDIYIEKHPTPQQKEKEDDVKIDGTIKYPQQSSVIKTGPKKIYKVNKCKAVKMGVNEDLAVISLKTDIEEEDLIAFNDLKPGQKIQPGQYVFLQPKRKKGADEKYKVKAEDNMWLIAQHKGVKLDRFLKRNLLTRGEEPEKGEWVYLKGKAPNKPKLRQIKEVPAPEMMVKNTITQPVKEYTKLPEDSKPPVVTNTQVQWEDPQKLGEKPVKPYEQVVPFDLAESEMTASNPGVKAKDLPMIEMDPIVPGKKTVIKSSGSKQHTVIKGDTMYNISKRYGVSIDDIRKWNNMPDNNVQLGQVLVINP